MKEKIINYNHPYFNNMLNSTKTWQEEKINHTAEHIGIISRGVLETLVREVRKKDMEELIMILNGAWSVELKIDDVVKLIKNYYTN